jgi:hypothetical protein
VIQKFNEIFQRNILLLLGVYIIFNIVMERLIYMFLSLKKIWSFYNTINSKLMLLRTGRADEMGFVFRWRRGGLI